MYKEKADISTEFNLLARLAKFCRKFRTKDGKLNIPAGLSGSGSSALQTATVHQELQRTTVTQHSPANLSMQIKKSATQARLTFGLDYFHPGLDKIVMIEIARKVKSSTRVHF